MVNAMHYMFSFRGHMDHAFRYLIIDHGYETHESIYTFTNRIRKDKTEMCC